MWSNVTMDVICDDRDELIVKNEEIGCLIDAVQISFFDTIECLMNQPAPHPKPCPQPKPCQCKNKCHCDCDC